MWAKRRKVLTLRSAVEASGPSLLSSLSELGARVAAAGGISGPSASAQAAFAAYKAQCRVHSNTPPMPLSVEKILGFLYAEMDRGRSNTDLGKVTSALLAYGATVNEVLPPSDLQLLKVGRRLLAVEFPSEVRRARPLSDASMLRVHAFLAPFLARRDLFALSWWAKLTVGYAGLYRGCELLGSALTWEQVTSVPCPRLGVRALILDCPFRKSDKETRDLDKDIHVVPPRLDLPALDPFKAMFAYASARGARLGEGDASVFPQFRKTDNSPARSDEEYPDGAARAHLRWILRSAGVPEPNRYGLHSLRRGGATRYLAIGLDWSLVKKLGAWKSDIWELYDARGLDLAESMATLPRGLL